MAELLVAGGYEVFSSAPVQAQLACKFLLMDSVIEQLRFVFRSPLASYNSTLLDLPLSQSLGVSTPLISVIGSLKAAEFVQRLGGEFQKGRYLRKYNNLLLQESLMERLHIGENSKLRPALFEHISRSGGLRLIFKADTQSFLDPGSGCYSHPGAFRVLDERGVLSAVEAHFMRFIQDDLQTQVTAWIARCDRVGAFHTVVHQLVTTFSDFSNRQLMSASFCSAISELARYVGKLMLHRIRHNARQLEYSFNRQTDLLSYTNERYLDRVD